MFSLRFSFKNALVCSMMCLDGRIRVILRHSQEAILMLANG